METIIKEESKEVIVTIKVKVANGITMETKVVMEVEIWQSIISRLLFQPSIRIVIPKPM